MVPAFLVEMERLPLTLNGKVDRKALPSPEGRLERVPYVAPRNEMERDLARIWGEVLHVEEVGMEDDFFDLGGESILALRVRAEARKQGYEFSLKELFSTRQIGKLATIAGVAEGVRRERIEPFSLLTERDRVEVKAAGYEDAYPLSRLQAGMVFHNLWERGSSTYHDVIGARIETGKDFDKGMLKRVLQSVVDRHPILRVTFHLSGYEVPLQCVHGQREVWLSVEEWSGLGEEEQERGLEAFVKEEAGREFDFAEGPLVKFFVHCLGWRRFQFTMSVHHAILDGWSVSRLLREICEQYVAGVESGRVPEQPRLKSSYGEFIAAEQRALNNIEDEAYWEGVVERVEATPLWRIERQEEAGGGDEDASERMGRKLPEEVAH
jgi:hypothetical protein